MSTIHNPMPPLGILKKEEKPVDFTKFKTVEECYTSTEFSHWFAELLGKHLDRKDNPYIDIWYALYIKLGEDTNDNYLANKLAEAAGFKRDSDPAKKTVKEQFNDFVKENPKTVTGRTGTSVPTPQALPKLKKEITMSFHTPVTTEVRHLINDKNVEVMSKQELFNAACELQDSIERLKKAKLDSKAVKKEVKQQKRILKTVINYLDAKK